MRISLFTYIVYKPENCYMNFSELLKFCETCDISISQQVDTVELNTKSQSKSAL